MAHPVGAPLEPGLPGESVSFAQTGSLEWSVPKDLSGGTIASIPVSASAPTRKDSTLKVVWKSLQLKDSLQRCGQGEGNLAGMGPGGSHYSEAVITPRPEEQEEGAALLVPLLGQTHLKARKEGPRVTSLSSAHRGQPCSKWSKGRVGLGGRISEQGCSFCPSTPHPSFR